MTLPRNKIALVHVAVVQLGLDDDDYRGLLRRVAFADSARDLDELGFNRVMEAFARLGFKSDFAARNIGQRPGMATPAQIARLRADWRLYTGGQGDDRSLGRWLLRQFKVSDVRFLTVETARKAIGALAVMIAKKGVSREAS